MIQRCTNPRATSFKNYGARGIVVCDRWRTSFEAFLADMGPRPSAQHSLDRRENNGNYEPGNCRWSTKIEQVRNSRLVRPVLRSDGKHYQTVTDAARDVGKAHTTICAVCRGTRRTSGGYGWAYA
jgi:hypothetical protein